MAEQIEQLPFQHYTRKHRAIAWVSTNLFDTVTYTVRNGLLKGMKRKGGLAWLPFGGAETAEHRFIRSLDVRGKVVYDVGAFHGLLSLWFSKTAREVVAFEPVRSNRNRLAENLALNRIWNVDVRDCGLGSEDGEAWITYSTLMPGGASVISAAGSDLVIEEIEIRRLDRLRGLPVPDLIKIDVEGFELAVLRGAEGLLSKYKPALYLEMHGNTIAQKKAKVRAIVSFLSEVGYKSIYHVESNSRIGAENADVAARGHLYCS